MGLRWYAAVVDCLDHVKLARWWAETLGWQVIIEAEDETVIIPPGAEDRPVAAAEWAAAGAGLLFGRAEERKTVKNRIHLDLAPHLSDDREALIASLLARGATRADVGQDESAVSWTVLADPEGNEFCVLSARDR